MNDEAVVRDYNHETDFEAVKAIHDQSTIDYQFPDLQGHLWLVSKVVEIDGKIRLAGAMYIQAEAYLWLDQTDWASPEDKLFAIKVLEREVLQETWLKGVDTAVLWLPPGMEGFGKRLTSDLGFTKDRDGWVTYSRPTRVEQNADHN